MYIFRYKTTLFIQNLYFLLKYFGKNFIFSVKSTNFLFFGDQMYIFGYKTTVFIQNLYILVKFFGKNFIFSAKSTIVLVFSEPNVHFWVQNYSFYPKFVHLVLKKTKTIVLFALKMKFLPKNFTKMYKFWIKMCTF